MLGFNLNTINHELCRCTDDVTSWLASTLQTKETGTKQNTGRRKARRC
jgi:hypothetical protein